MDPALQERFLQIGIKSNYASVDFVQFGVLSPDEIVGMSVCEVTNTCLKGESKNEENPLVGSVYDPKMGALGNNSFCETCGHDAVTCVGHFGHITLPVPVIHPTFFKTIVLMLKCVCSFCGRVLLSKDQAQLEGLLKYRGQNRLKELVKRCKKITSCRECNNPQPTFVVKDNKLKKYFTGTDGKHIDVTTEEVDGILTRIPIEDVELLGLNNELYKKPIFMQPENIITPGLTHCHQSHPSSMVLKVLPVLPPAARPYSIRDGEQNDDDLTDKYIQIVKCVQKLNQKENSDPQPKKGRKRMVLKEADRKKIIAELEANIKALFDNSDGQSQISGGRPHKGIKERLSSKDGQVRQNLQGKRVNFSGRTVIDSGPENNIDELGVPREMAKILTKPLPVTGTNVAQMQKLVDDGKVNFIVRAGNQIIVRDPTGRWNAPRTEYKTKIGEWVSGGASVRFVTHANIRELKVSKKKLYILRKNELISIKDNTEIKPGDIALDEEPRQVIEETHEEIQEDLDIGLITFVAYNTTIVERIGNMWHYHKLTLVQPRDVVERELQDGDWVLLNRQPTLRIESMMGLKVKVVDGKSLRLNLAITGPFNADFDGKARCRQQEA